jgi:hypothetical protein
MAETLTHWKKLTNPDYLGAYALEPGKDLVVTIKKVGREMVIGPDGKKEECIVAHFTENGVKPMILNVTNCKTISKLAKTSYIEKWSGLKIQIFVDKVRAFGDIVEALRIRPYAPKQAKQVEERQEEDLFECCDCGREIESFNGQPAEFIAQYTEKKYGKRLCGYCAINYAEAKAHSDEQDALAGVTEKSE